MLQLLVRCLEVDVKLSLNHKQSLDAELQQMMRLLSYYRMLVQESDTKE